MNKEIVVLIPIYNPDIEITNEFLKQLTKKFKNIVFVNDGCSSDFNDFFEKLEKKYPVIRHNVNLGKGRGLKNGINYILNNYPDAKAIVTGDCDGQHSINDILRCSKVALKYPDSLILGCRNFDNPDVPTKSKFGNKLTRNILDIFVGKEISDTQTGLRAMSLELAKRLIAVSGERYEYETNVLIETKKKNIPIKEVEIETIYINDNGTSHFNPIKDSIRIYSFFTKYFIGALIAYLVELFTLYKSFNAPKFFISIVVYLLIAKCLSCIITYILNRHIDLFLVVLSFVINSILFLFFNLQFIWIKILVDTIILILVIILNNFATQKEVI